MPRLEAGIQRLDERNPPVIAHTACHIGPTGPVSVDRVKLVFLTAGWSTLRTETDEFGLVPGSIVIIPSGLVCEGFPAPFARTVTLYLHDEFIRAQLPWLPTAHPLVHHLVAAQRCNTCLGLVDIGESGNRAVVPLLRLITETSRAHSNALSLLARIADLLDAVALHIGRPSHVQASALGVRVPRPSVTDAIRVMHAQLDHRWTVVGLARAVALSPSQLTRQFVEDLGTSPAAFLRAARADRMAELLAGTGLGVAEAGRQVGWPDVSTASRVFRDRYGQSPSAFVKSVRDAHTVSPSLAGPGN